MADQVGNKAFYVYGFAKNARGNIKADELRALKAYAAVLLGYGEKELKKALKTGVLIELENDG